MRLERDSIPGDSINQKYVNEGTLRGKLTRISGKWCNNCEKTPHRYVCFDNNLKKTLNYLTNCDGSNTNFS